MLLEMAISEDFVRSILPMPCILVVYHDQNCSTGALLHVTVFSGLICRHSPAKPKWSPQLVSDARSAKKMKDKGVCAKRGS